MMLTPRDRRLIREFERMKALVTPRCLFSFRCASLDESEASELLRANLGAAKKGLGNFLTPLEFEHRYPGLAPEKYLILYDCRGLMEEENKIVV